MKNHIIRLSVCFVMGFFLIASPRLCFASNVDTVISDTKSSNDNKDVKDNKKKSLVELNDDFDLLSGKANTLATSIVQKNKDCKKTILALKSGKDVDARRLSLFNRNEKDLILKTADMSKMTLKLKKQNEKLDSLYKKYDKLRQDYDTELKSQKPSKNRDDMEKELKLSLIDVIDGLSVKNDILVEISGMLDSIFSLLQ